MSVTRIIVLQHFTKSEVRRSSSSEDMAGFSVTALSGLVTLTFDLSTCERGHGSRFLPANFQSAYFRYRLRSSGVNPCPCP